MTLADTERSLLIWLAEPAASVDPGFSPRLSAFACHKTVVARGVAKALRGKAFFTLFDPVRFLASLISSLGGTLLLRRFYPGFLSAASRLRVP